MNTQKPKKDSAEYQQLKRKRKREKLEADKNLKFHRLALNWPAPKVKKEL